MALLNPLSNAFGLDIGDRSFKVAQLTKRGRSTKPYRLIAWGGIAVPEGVMERGEILDVEAAAEHVNKLLSQSRGVKGRSVVACLPEAQSFVKLVEIPKHAREEEIKRIVIREIEQNIPLKFDEIYYDWQKVEEDEAARESAIQAQAAEEIESKSDEEKAPTDETEGEKSKEEGGADNQKTEEEAAKAPPQELPARILIAAAPKNLIDNYTRMLETAGLAPVAFEIEAIAIARAIVPIDKSFYGAFGILDIGATRSSLVIFDEGVLQMSISIPISGNELTHLISEKLGISTEDAELVKIECGLDAHRCEDRMWKILLPIIDDMCAKIRNALRFYKIGFPMGKKIERLYLCGGGAHFREIDSVLSRKLTIKVRRGDSLANIRRPRSFPEEKALTYTTAIGLALRAADEGEKNRRSVFRF